MVCLPFEYSSFEKKGFCEISFYSTNAPKDKYLEKRLSGKSKVRVIRRTHLHHNRSDIIPMIRKWKSYQVLSSRDVTTCCWEFMK